MGRLGVIKMKNDCGFMREPHWFRYRTGGILIHDGEMLFVKSRFGGYYYMVGGGVHLGETSQSCIQREILEETGLHTEADYLAVVCENFFKGKGGKIDGLDCHEIEFYYVMKLSDDDITHCRTSTDDGEELIWLPLEEIPASNIKPVFLKELIPTLIQERRTLHIIEESDR